MSIISLVAILIGCSLTMTFAEEGYTITLDWTTKTYTGSSFAAPVPTVVSADGTVVSSSDYYYIITTPQGTNYSSKYYDMSEVVKHAGKYTLEVFRNTYSYADITSLGVVEFIVEQKDLNDPSITIEPIKNQKYTGKALTPDITLKDTGLIYYDSISSSDYMITYSNNIDGGQATVTIEAIKDIYGNYTGNYKGIRTVCFTIVKPISKAAFSEVESRTYRGSAITPSVSVTDQKADGSVVSLQQDVDYTISYESNNACGVGRIIIKGIGVYSGYHIIKFGIFPKKISGVKVRSPHYMEATVTWNKVEGADGYVVYRKAKGGSYKRIATITDGNYQVFHDFHKKLVSGKRYTYKIVPYIVDPFSLESLDGEVYKKPTRKNDAMYSNYTSYYSGYYSSWYSYGHYSVIKGKCTNAIMAKEFGEASGTVTSSTDGKSYAIYTGDADLDYICYLTLKNIKTGSSDEAKVKGIFNWMKTHVKFADKNRDDFKYGSFKFIKSKYKCYYNYTTKAFHKKALAYEEKIQKQIYTGKALCNGTDWTSYDRCLNSFAFRQGSCSFITPMFNVMLGAKGVESYRVSGYYVNDDGSMMDHNFTLAKVNGKYYWYDAPIACRHPSSASYWYKKGNNFNKRYHKYSAEQIKGIPTSKFAK